MPEPPTEVEYDEFIDEGDPTNPEDEDVQPEDDDHEDIDPGDQNESDEDPEDEEGEEPEEDEEDQPEDEEETDQEDQEDEESDQEEDEDTATAIEAISSQLGVEMPEDKEYDNDLDGVTELVRDASQQFAQQQVNQLFETYPEVGRLLQFRANGGDIEEYVETINQPDWGEMEVPEDNVQRQKEIIERRMRKEGFEDEDINEALEEHESAGTLQGEAKRSKKRLAKIQQEEREQLEQQQQEEAENRKQQVQEYWQDVEQTIQERNELLGLQLPESQKSEFFSFLTEPVDKHNGRPVSRKDQIVQNADLETTLAVDYILYLTQERGVNLADLIASQAKTENAKDLQSLLKTSQGKRKPKDKGPSGGGDGSSDDVDVDQILDIGEAVQ